MRDFTMVVPSYWGRGGGAYRNAEQVVFDHPTPLDSEGTLGRLLGSLDVLDEVAGRIVVVAVPNERGIAAEVEDKGEENIAPYRERYDICSLGVEALEEIRGRLARRGVSEEALEMVNMDNYAGVRNVCALAGMLEGSACTIFIDDDEVFTDRDFLKKIEENIGRECGEGTIEALAGYYLQPDTYRLDEGKVPEWRRAYWSTAAAMNEAFDRFIGEGERLKPTPFVFGGNMAVSLDALKSVPFDPKITRGEDIDFLLNLRVNGIRFYLNRELAIKHLPPGSSQADWKKLREDAVRFLYDRKKVRDHGELSLQDLQPYPGRFLGDDLEERIVKTCELLKREYESKGDEDGARECESIVAMVEENPYADFDTRSWLKEITGRWREVTEAAAGMGFAQG